MKTNEFIEKNQVQVFFEDIENLLNEMPKTENPFYSYEKEILSCLEEASRNLNGISEAISFQTYWIEFAKKNSHLLNKNPKAFSEYILLIRKNIESAMAKTSLVNENGIKFFHYEKFPWKYNEIRNSFLQK